MKNRIIRLKGCCWPLCVLIWTSCSRATTAPGSLPEQDQEHWDAGARDVDSGVEGATTSSSSAFFGLLNFSSVSEEPRSDDGLVDDAVLIVRGRFVGVEEGRVVDFAEGTSNPIHMAVFHFAVNETLKGPDTPTAYVEHIRGGIPVQSYRDVLPQDLPIILFLRDASGWDPPVYKIEGDETGRPQGTRLHTYLTDQGLVMEDEGGLVYPLADDPDQEVFDETRIASLDELAQEIIGLR
jgi:hypothetical protein